MKPIQLEQLPLDFSDSDKIHGGLSAKEFRVYNNKLQDAQAKMDTIKSSQSNIWQQAEENGVNKGILKMVKKIEKGSDDAIADDLRAFRDYCHALGLFEKAGFHMVLAVGPDVELESGDPAEPQETNVAAIALKTGKPKAAAAAH